MCHVITACHVFVGLFFIFRRTRYLFSFFRLVLCNCLWQKRITQLKNYEKLFYLIFLSVTKCILGSRLYLHHGWLRSFHPTCSQFILTAHESEIWDSFDRPQFLSAYTSLCRNRILCVNGNNEDEHEIPFKCTSKHVQVTFGTKVSHKSFKSFYFYESMSLKTFKGETCEKEATCDRASSLTLKNFPLKSSFTNKRKNSKKLRSITFPL